MTKETEVTAEEEGALRTKDREEEVVETVEMDPPEPEERMDIEDVIATQEDPRAEIYKRQREKREAEIAAGEAGFGDDETQVDGFSDETEQEAVENEESTAIIEPSPSHSDTPPDSDPMVQVKILGDVREVPQSKVDAMGGVENYQIRIAAQEQMERNAHERAANEARQAALDERERQLNARQAEVPAMDPQQAKNPDRSTPTDGQTLEEQARRYQEAVYDDADEAPSILASMVQNAANTGQQFDEQAFRRQVKEDVLAEQRQAKIVKAGRALIQAHPELQERNTSFDPRMYNAIDAETTVVEREHPDWEPEQVVQEAFDRIQKWKGLPQTETMSDKQAEKRAMTRPRSGTQRYAPPPPPPRQTNADYVREERKRRGLE